jgi:DNA-binding GntR family transcriptional regulator
VLKAEKPAPRLGYEGPLQRRRLGDDVTRRIREALQNGKFEPGERLAVQTLADELAVSTMPVREALIALRNEGLVESIPGRGFRALRPRPIDIEDVFAIHAFIARRFAERAAESITEDVLDQLRFIQGEISRVLDSKLGDTEIGRTVEELNFAFHRAINSVVDAPRLTWFLRATTRHVPRGYYTTVPGWPEASLSDHGAIIDALAAHDGPRAGQLMELHIVRGGRLAAEHSRGLEPKSTKTSPQAPQRRTSPRGAKPHPR